MNRQLSPIAFTLEPEQRHHQAEIEALHAHAFGPGRFARTAFRLREGRASVDGLSFVACRDARPVGSIRFSHVHLAGAAGLLLGPLVVQPDLAGQGIGLALMQTSLAAARAAAQTWVVLVGDEPYYARVGFARVPVGKIILPGPVDPARLLFLDLTPGAMMGLHGVLHPGQQ